MVKNWIDESDSRQKSDLALRYYSSVSTSLRCSVKQEETGLAAALACGQQVSSGAARSSGMGARVVVA